MIIFGQKRKITRLGLVADFCSICRAMQPHVINQHNLVGQIYFLPFAKGKVLGFMATCQSCRLDFAVDPGKYQKILEGDEVNILKLISETYPDYQKKDSYRLELEAKVSGKQALLPAERLTMLYQPFEAVIFSLEQRLRGGSQLDKQSRSSCLITMFVPMLIALLAGLLPGTDLSDNLSLLVFLVGTAGTIVTMYLLMTGFQRYLIAKIYPALGTCLSPLQPSLLELQQILDILKDEGYNAARRFRPERIIELIER